MKRSMFMFVPVVLLAAACSGNMNPGAPSVNGTGGPLGSTDTVFSAPGSVPDSFEECGLLTNELAYPDVLYIFKQEYTNPRIRVEFAPDPGGRDAPAPVAEVEADATFPDPTDPSLVRFFWDGHPVASRPDAATQRYQATLITDQCEGSPSVYSF